MNTPETIIVNGKQAVVLVPELVENLAIVDLAVIKRLAALLPTANLRDIKENLYEQIRRSTTLEQYVIVLSNEVSFHRSVNMITEYQPEPVLQDVEEQKARSIDVPTRRSREI